MRMIQQALAEMARSGPEAMIIRRPCIPHAAKLPRQLVIALAMLSSSTFAADDPQTQINALQGAVGECRQQQADVSNGAQVRAADYMAEIGRLRKRVAELEEVAKKPEPKK